MSSKNPFEIYSQSSPEKVDTGYKKKTVDIFDSSTSFKARFSRLGVNLKKANYLGFFIATCLVILFIRLFYLQISEGDSYRAIAEENRLRIQTTKASRGIIYDRNQEPLVKNIPNFMLNISPQDFPTEQQEQEQIISEIHQITGISKEEINQKISEVPSSTYQTYTLLEQLPYVQALVLISATRQWPGIDLKTAAIREYLHPQSMSPFMGYIGKINEEELKENPGKYLMTDYLGKAGLENTYEDLLKGEDGKKQIEVNSRGKEKEVVSEKKQVPGKNIVLGLDLGLQEKATEILQHYIDQTQAPGGTVIAIDPRNGEILTIATLPSYDNNKFIQGLTQEEYSVLLEDKNKPLFNRAFGGTYPPGSTFKLIVAAAALEEGEVTTSTTFNSTGGIRIGDWYFPDWKAGGHGTTDVRKAIAESVNTYFYLAGGGTYNAEEREIEGGIGVDKINQYAEEFYINQALGIDLPGEKSGFLPTKEWKEETKGEMWYIGDTYHYAIGQGDALVTPLHIASTTSVFANGGTLYKPHLLRSINNEYNEVIQHNEPEILNQNFINSYNVQVVKEGMGQAVTSGSGSARSMQILPVSSGGKTGTAQAPGTDRTHSWFTCFAPYENPEIVITVLVEEGGGGNDAALPVAREMLNYYYNRDNEAIENIEE